MIINKIYGNNKQWGAEQEQQIKKGKGEYDNGNQLYLHYKNESSNLSFSRS